MQKGRYKECAFDRRRTSSKWYQSYAQEEAVRSLLGELGRQRLVRLSVDVQAAISAKTSAIDILVNICQGVSCSTTAGYAAPISGDRESSGEVGKFINAKLVKHRILGKMELGSGSGGGDVRLLLGRKDNSLFVERR
jgi:hypothetical protein